ncbi:MAG: hypothetical protein FWF60_08245 [Oscillospiraceae bacterium]|nr:hypothetical protein [Oscillospiraceae bacterium]
MKNRRKNAFILLRENARAHNMEGVAENGRYWAEKGLSRAKPHRIRGFPEKIFSKKD